MLAATDREGRYDVGIEGRRVIVIDENDNVGLLLLFPFPGPFVSGKYRSEIIVLTLALVNGDAQQRNVT